MKSVIKFLFFSLFLVAFISCQNEIDQVIQPTDDEALNANAVVTTLVQRTVSKDGSKDNIIDKASCINVELPVTVIVNGVEIIVDSEEDFEVIEAIFDEFDDDDDDLQIIFPITIILSDYTEVTINNYNELEGFAEGCKGENEYDDDIECLDFVYPINLSVYDSQNQFVKTIVVESDKQFYKFIDEIHGYHVVVINFPIQVVLYDGSTVVIENMDELKSKIEEVKDVCDEDDDYDYDDDDCNHCTEQQTLQLMKTCRWRVHSYKKNGAENAEQYKNYLFTFLEDGTVKAEDNGNYLYGTWEVEQTNSGILVKISFENLADFSFNWMLYEIEDDNEVDLRFGENKLEFKKVCGDDKQELVNTLKEGKWIVANFNDEGESKTTLYNDFEIDFLEDFSVTATKGNDVVNGTWDVYYDSGELKLDLDFGDTVPFDELNEDWDVVDVKSNRVEVKDINDSNIESNLVFEQI